MCRRFVALIGAAAVLAGCEESVRAVPLADDTRVDAPPAAAIFDLLRIETPGASRREDGTEITFEWRDGRTLVLREIGDARGAGRRADYTAQFSLEDAEAPLLCRLRDDAGTPELIGDVVLCGRAFEARCRGGEAPPMGVSGFWCLEELATLAIDPESSRGAYCGAPALDVARAPEEVRRAAEALSIARVVRNSSDGTVELSTPRSCSEGLRRGHSLMLHSPDGEAHPVEVWEIHHPSADRCDVRIRIDASDRDLSRALWLVAPPCADCEARDTSAPPLPLLDDARVGALRHDFDLDRDGHVDAIVRSADRGEDARLLILDAEHARWYLHAGPGDVG